IRADADRDAVLIRAEAYRKSEQIRGDGDGERNRIFAESFGKDPEFAAFYRHMQAYETALKSNDTRLLLSPDSEFFKYFTDPGGAKTPPPAPGGLPK
ncbi:MAG: protease modulator HflC, partial [Hyphomicrobiaceae bacterium]